MVVTAAQLMAVLGPVREADGQFVISGHSLPADFDGLWSPADLPQQLAQAELKADRFRAKCGFVGASSGKLGIAVKGLAIDYLGIRRPAAGLEELDQAVVPGVAAR